jgi:DNA replication initiation complex subunit (GINS family)
MKFKKRKKTMDLEEINYRSLRKIQQLEKNSPILTELNPGFYNDHSEYLKALDKRLDIESSSQKKLLVKEEISNAKKIAINIYELREKKIILAAVTKTRGGNPDISNMLESEKNLYDSILEILKRQRHIILEKEKVENVVNKSIKVDSENVKKNTNPIVKVNQNLPEFIGIDTKKYNLRKGDVLSISKEMSEILSKKGAVEELEV